MSGSSMLRGKIAALRRLVRLAMLSVGLGKLLCLAAALALLDFGLDSALRLPWEARAALLLAGAAALLCQLMAQVALPSLRPIPEGALAFELEQRLGLPADLLPSALRFMEGPLPAPGEGAVHALALRAAALQQAEAEAAALVPTHLVRWQPARNWLLLAAVAVALPAALTVAEPGGSGLWFRRNVLLARVEWPPRTKLVALEAPEFVPRGEAATVAVRAQGRIPRTARLGLRGTSSGAPRALVMERSGADTFVADLGPLEETVLFTVRAGDAVLGERRIEAVDRPGVARARMVVKPPAYIATEEAEVPWNAPVFDVPTGSRVTIAVEATKPLSLAVLKQAEGAEQSQDRAGALDAAFDLPVTGDLRGEIVLRDTLGLWSGRPLPFEIRAVPDRPPVVGIVGEGVGEMLVPDARIPLSVQAADDYGVAALWLEETYEDAGGATAGAPVELWGGPARREAAVEHVIELRGRGLRPRGRFLVRAAARDNCALEPTAEVPGGPNTGFSASLSFRLVTVHELLGALLLRQQDLRRDLEQQMAAQEQLRRGLREALAGSSVRPQGLEELQARERALANVSRSVAAQYQDVLAQMLNNRVVTDAVHGGHLAAIVRPLERLASVQGAIMRAADALGGTGRRQAASDEALAMMQGALTEMQQVRARMMLLEGFASLVASVEEIAREQGDLLRQTEGLRTSGRDGPGAAE